MNRDTLRRPTWSTSVSGTMYGSECCHATDAALPRCCKTTGWPPSDALFEKAQPRQLHMCRVHLQREHDEDQHQLQPQRYNAQAQGHRQHQHAEVLVKESAISSHFRKWRPAAVRRVIHIADWCRAAQCPTRHGLRTSRLETFCKHFKLQLSTAATT